MIKPTVLIIFVLGIAGYNFLCNYHKTYYSLRRSSGYHTFFKSSAIGLVLFCIAACLYFWLVTLGYKHTQEQFYGQLFLETVFSKAIDNETASLFEISILTLALSQILPWFYYLPQDKKELMKTEFLEDAESPELTRLFNRSSLTGVPVLFTMSDRKVYIGYIYEIQSKQFTDIYILPLFSGYRCKEELKLKKVTPYKPVVDELERRDKDKLRITYQANGLSEEEVENKLMEYLNNRNIWADFIVALPLREIIHAHLHDFSHENLFKKQEEVQHWIELGSFRY